MNRASIAIGRVSTALALLLCVAGCTGLFHSDARPEEVYYLRAAPVPAGTAPVAASLRINRPTANPGLESNQIMLVKSDRLLSFFLGSRWPASPSNMVETLAVEKLRGSGLWQSVADSAAPFPSDYVLLVNVRHFEADYTGGGVAPDVHVVLDCTVGKREGREVIRSFLAEGTAPASANKLSAVVAAFESATNAALDSLSTQTIAAVRTSMSQKHAD